jgi:Glycine rich protein
LVGLATLAFAGPAAATTETFSFTGAAQTWTVPAGVTQATFDLYGAQGFGSAAGLGGRATATIAVTPAASIQVNVGGQGQSNAGGFNGGGGGTGFNSGGGASDIRIGGTALADRKLVAGGGGGAGGCTAPEGFTEGGDGGGAEGDDAFTPAGCTIGLGTRGGGGGKQTTGGSATAPATPGSFGGGGAEGQTLEIAGGSGGGGWWGGGGGVNGGGGGSGHRPEGAVFESWVGSGNGLVTVTHTVSAIETLCPRLAAPRHRPTTASASAS